MTNTTPPKELVDRLRRDLGKRFEELLLKADFLDEDDALTAIGVFCDVVPDIAREVMAGARPLSPVEIEPRPQAGDRVRGTDLDGVTRVGKLVGFFAWSHEEQRNTRAHVDLDDGTKTVVHTASLRRLAVRDA